MALDPTWYNALIDETTPGSGTPVDKALISGLGTAIRFAVISNTQTGAINDWAPAGLSGHTIIEWNGAADLALTGLAGGTIGQIVIVKNVTTTKIATFAHNHSSSAAANRFQNMASVGLTAIAASGFAAFYHNGTNWRLVQHDQGAWITPAYSAGNFTSPTGTWTVDSGDVTTYAYRLAGRTLTFTARIDTSSVTVTPAALYVAIPAGLTSAKSVQDAAVVLDNTTTTSDVGVAFAAVAGVRVEVFLKTFAAWANATNTTGLRFTLSLEVQ